MAPGTIGTRAERTAKPRPCSASHACTPDAASSPKADPPESAMASTPCTVCAGSRSAVSRVPGPPPRTSMEATAGASSTTAVTPEARRASSALPTSTPGTSVMRLRRAGKMGLRRCEPLPSLTPDAHQVNAGPAVPNGLRPAGRASRPQRDEVTLERGRPAALDKHTGAQGDAPAAVALDGHHEAPPHRVVSERAHGGELAMHWRLVAHCIALDHRRRLDTVVAKPKVNERPCREHGQRRRAPAEHGRLMIDVR